jgi:hypothetical protein
MIDHCEKGDCYILPHQLYALIKAIDEEKLFTTDSLNHPQTLKDKPKNSEVATDPPEIYDYLQDNIETAKSNVSKENNVKNMHLSRRYKCPGPDCNVMPSTFAALLQHLQDCLCGSWVKKSKSKDLNYLKQYLDPECDRGKERQRERQTYLRTGMSHITMSSISTRKES